MPTKSSLEATPLKQLQRYHHSTLNTFGDGETLVEAIHRRPGIYGQNPIAYLSLMARRPSLTLGDLEEALVNDRSLVRATAFRGSLFLIASEDYPLYYRALHDTLSAMAMARLRGAGFDEAAVQRFGERLHAHGFGMAKTEKEVINILFPGKERRPGLEVERMLLRKLCDIGVLVRTTCKGWKGNQFSFALADQWLEGVTLAPEQIEQARVEVVRRYLRAYGPARLEDIAWWTGMPSAEVRRILELLGREVVKFAVDGLGDGLVTLREVADQTRKGGGAFAPSILFLPLWDAYPLGWRDRTRIVEPRFAPWVYDPAGNTSSIIVEDGRCIGVWQFRDSDSITLEFHIFEPYANRLNAVRLAAETHAGQLAVVAGARDVRVIERALPAPLADRPAASFFWPLGKEPVFRLGENDDENPMDRRERQPNVLRSKFLDDERLVRPAAEAPRPERSERPERIAAPKPILKADAPPRAPREQHREQPSAAPNTPAPSAQTPGKGSEPVEEKQERRSKDRPAPGTASPRAQSQPPTPASGRAATERAAAAPKSSKKASRETPSRGSSASKKSAAPAKPPKAAPARSRAKSGTTKPSAAKKKR